MKRPFTRLLQDDDNDNEGSEDDDNDNEGSEDDNERESENGESEDGE